jgi:hypothetical protein
MPIAENEGESQVVEGGCQAYFGYRNENPFEVSIAIGDRNQFNFIYPSENVVLEPAEQVTNFLVGRQNGVFSVTWNSSTGENFIWSLDGHSAVARWCNPPE